MGRYLTGVFLFFAGNIYAEDYFNPAFLSSDTVKVVDLSRFSSADTQPEGNYQTEVYVNNAFVGTEKIGFFRYGKDSHDYFQPEPGAGNLVPCISRSLLDELGYIKGDSLKFQNVGEGCVPIKRLHPDTKVSYKFSAMRLDFTIPQASLANSGEGYISPARWDEGIPAVLINYSLSGANIGSESNYYGSFNSALNYGAWRLHNQSGVSLDNHGQSQAPKWTNISTYAERDWPALGAILTAGDSSAGGEVFDNIAYRGLRIHTSDSMLPDNQVGYAPVITGTARTPARIVIRQNGFIVYQRYVAPGKFAIRDLSSYAANGDLNVTVEEKDGRSEVFSVPFSTLPVLKREGQLKYDLVGGEFRTGNLQQSKPLFLQGSFLRGFGKDITGYGGMQLSGGYESVLFGMGKNLGSMGAVSFDITHARSLLSDDTRHVGKSYRFLYAKSLSSTGTTVRLTGYRYSTHNFYTFEDTTYRDIRGYSYSDITSEEGYTPTDYHDLGSSRKGRLELSLYQSLGDYGSLSLNGGQQTFWNRGSGKQTWYQLSYNTTWRKVNFGVSLSQSKSVGQFRANKQMNINISVPLSIFSNTIGTLANKAYLTYSSNSTNSSGRVYNTGISGSAFEDNRLTYSIQDQSSQNGHGATAALDYIGSRGRIGGSYSYSPGRRDINMQAEGGIVLHKGGVTFSQPLGDTNILVSAPGASHIRVRGQSNIQTDSRGYAVIPFASEYRHNRIELDMASAGNHTEITKNISDVIPTKGALVRAGFKVKKGYRVMFRLTKNQFPVPFGTVVTEDKSQSTGLADESGNAYLSGLPAKGMLKLSWGQGEAGECKIKYFIPEDVRSNNIITLEESCL